jgi:hypothetical protein
MEVGGAEYDIFEVAEADSRLFKYDYCVIKYLHEPAKRLRGNFVIRGLPGRKHHTIRIYHCY